MQFYLTLTLALKGSRTFLLNQYRRRFNVNIKPPTVFSNTRQFTSDPLCKKLFAKMPSKALVLIANGTEELECITVVNILRRGSVEVTLAGVDGCETMTCKSNSKICPDTSLTEAANDKYDIIVLPGGLEGTKTFSNSKALGNLLKQQEANSGYIAAICAAPVALKKHNIGIGKHITSYPALASELKNSYVYVENSPVVIDAKLITSRGPATAYIFGLTILETLEGKEIAKKVADAMLYNYE